MTMETNILDTIKNNRVTDDVLTNNTYTNPKGTLYVSANSSSGSNYNGIDTENVGPECDFWFQSDTLCYGENTTIVHKAVDADEHQQHQQIRQKIGTLGLLSQWVFLLALQR